MRNPRNATAANTPNGIISAFGEYILVAAENSDPDRKGPTARPPAPRVCASPLIRPRTLLDGAELVT